TAIRGPGPNSGNSGVAISFLSSSSADDEESISDMVQIRFVRRDTRSRRGWQFKNSHSKIHTVSPVSSVWQSVTDQKNWGVSMGRTVIPLNSRMVSAAVLGPATSVV